MPLLWTYKSCYDRCVLPTPSPFISFLSHYYYHFIFLFFTMQFLRLRDFPFRSPYPLQHCFSLYYTPFLVSLKKLLLARKVINEFLNQILEVPAMPLKPEIKICICFGKPNLQFWPVFKASTRVYGCSTTGIMDNQLTIKYQQK